MKKNKYLIFSLIAIPFFHPTVYSSSTFGSSRRARSGFFLNEISSGIAVLKARLNELNMRYYLGEDVGEEKNRVDEEMREFFSNADYYKFICQGLENAKDGLDKREFYFLKLYFDFMRVSSLPEIKELENGIMQKRKEFLEYKEEALPKPKNPTPQYYEEEDRLWKNFGKEVEPLMRKLVKLRNEKTEELGYQGWLDLKFKLNEIDKNAFDKLFKELQAAIPDLFAPIIAKAREETGWDKIYNVHMLPEYKLIKSYVDRTPEGGLVNSAFKTLESIGIKIPAGDDSPIKIIYSKDFLFAAYNFLIRAGKNGESVIIFNLKRIGYNPDTILHEIGHTVHDYFIDENLPLELQRWEGIYSAYSEAMANVLDLLNFDKELLSKFFIIKDDINGKEITRPLNKQETEQFVEALTVHSMVDILYWIGNYELENEIYKNPDQNFEELFTKIKIEDKREDFPIRFSWSQMLPFFASSDESVYYQNYILSFIIAAQVQAALKEKFGTVSGNSKIGEFLINKLYKFGMSRPWQEVIEEATGRELSARDLINLISSGLNSN